MAATVIPFTQSATTAALTQPATYNYDKLAGLGTVLSARFTQYESDRRMAELKWTRNARQVLGVYDPEVDNAIDKNRSRAYPKLTRVKCVSMLSRLMNLLFPASEKNWGVEPSKVPDLNASDLQQVLDAVMQASQGQVPNDDAIERAVRKFAEKRAQRLELEIEDQLQELGGARSQDYVALCRKVLNSGIQYGAGVLRGPYVEECKQRFWQLANNRLTANERTVQRPRYEFISIWDYYPDMSAKTFASMDGQFVRRVLSPHQLRALKKRSDFIEKQIDVVLSTYPSGNYKRRPYETELRALGPQLNTSSAEVNKYEAVVWEGFVSGAELANCGVKVAQDKLADDVRAQVWMVGSIIIKAEIDPWTQILKDGEDIQQFHIFVFEEDESFLLGNGLPNIVRDSQLGLCAAARMAIDNGSVQRVFEVNTALLRTDQEITAINPDMLIFRDDDNPATVQVPAIKAVELPLNLEKLQALGNWFREFADSETFVNAATGGDMQKGPSEPFRTAAGASMLRGDAALPFKDVVRNFDVFTESLIGSMIMFNRKFNPNPNISGDFTAVARGATSLIAKEVQGMQLDNLAQTLTDEEKRYLDGRRLLRLRMKVRDMLDDDIVYDDEKCDQIDAQIAQQQQAEQAMIARTGEATVRKILSDALKNIAQANKNAAGAEATIANVILAGLEKGLNPDMLASTIPTTGAQDGSQSTGGAQPGAPAADSAASLQQRPGVGGLEAATGAAAASPGSLTAAMPAA